MKYILTIFICLFCVTASFGAGGLSGYAQLQNGANKPANLVDTNELKNKINEILKNRLPGAEVVSFRQIPKNGVIIYDCNVFYNGSTVKLYINPQNGAISGKMDNNHLLDEKITKTAINKGAKEVNNVLKQINLDASFSDVKYNKKDKTLEGSILYMNNKYYFKMNATTGEVIEMRALN